MSVKLFVQKHKFVYYTSIHAVYIQRVYRYEETAQDAILETLH